MIIPNKLLESMYQNKFSTSELKILMLVASGTHEHSIESISNATGLYKPNISKTINNLIRDKVLLEKRPPYSHSPRVLEVNENYSEWENHEKVI